MFAASKTAAVSGAAPDDKFNYVTMLLHGDGTNGAQNNTFLDSSTNNFSITRNGNTTQGSFSPYGSNWSNFFDGNGDYLTCSASVPATGAFTVEMFLFPTSTAGYQLLFSQYTSGNAGSLQLLWDDTTDKFTVNIGTGTVLTSTSTYALNTWHHLAITRDGSNNMTMWVNGASAATATNSTSILQTTTFIGTRSVALDGYFNGYISNLRVTNTAVYTTSFTPSTTPLTAISGTSLLTCQSNRFVDNSTNAFTITRNGDTSVQRFNPFGTSTAYDTSVIGGSGYFDGTGDTLTCTGTLPATADFTLSLWVYPTSLAGYAVAIQQSGSGNTFYLYLGYADGKTDIQVGSTNYNDYTAGVYKANQWNYVQVVKASSAYSFYVNGTALSVTSSTGNIGTTSIASGTLTVNYNTGCYITDVRIVNTALSNSVPTSPLTAVSGTTMLLSMQNGAIFDNAMINNLETVGNAQISTSVKKYGTGSMSFVRSPSSYLVANNKSGIFSFGTGDFTVEAWVYLNSMPTAVGYPENYWIVGGGPANSNAGFDISIGSTDLVVNLVSFASPNILEPHGMTTSTWYHIAVTRSGATLYAFINGSVLATASVTGVTANPCLTGLAISAAEPVGATEGNFNGYIDDLRITKGYARYTAAFTPPTAAFPNTGPI